LQDIDPHVLLLIFLPVIGFAPALEQEPHLLRKNWGQVGWLLGSSSSSSSSSLLTELLSNSNTSSSAGGGRLSSSCSS
jgi:hypothetical protein